MIKLKTDCDTCLHKDICKYKDNAKTDMNKLKDMNYETGPNDDYSWNDISNSRHVDIIFSCIDYRNGQTAIQRR